MEDVFIDKAIVIGLKYAHDSVVLSAREGLSTEEIIETLRNLVTEEGGPSEHPNGTYEEQYRENAQ